MGELSLQLGKLNEKVVAKIEWESCRWHWESCRCKLGKLSLQLGKLNGKVVAKIKWESCRYNWESWMGKLSRKLNGKVVAAIEKVEWKSCRCKLEKLSLRMIKLSLRNRIDLSVSLLARKRRRKSLFRLHYCNWPLLDHWFPKKESTAHVLFYAGFV